MRISDWSSDVCSSDLPALKAIFSQPIRAIAGRSPVIGLENGIAEAGEILRQPVETPFVAGCRAPMRQNDGRQVLRFLAGRQRQISGNGDDIRRPVGDRLYACELTQVGSAPSRQRVVQVLWAWGWTRY